MRLISTLDATVALMRQQLHHLAGRARQRAFRNLRRRSPRSVERFLMSALSVVQGSETRMSRGNAAASQDVGGSAEVCEPRDEEVLDGETGRQAEEVGADLVNELALTPFCSLRS